MKNISNLRKIIQDSALIIFLITILSAYGSCVTRAASILPLETQIEIVVAVGLDNTLSFKGFRKLDTCYVADLCNIVSETGGLVVVYGICGPTDQSGLRCYIKPIPKLDKNLILSKQVEVKGHINATIKENRMQIHKFLIAIHQQIFNSGNNITEKIHETDIVGFFRKVDILFDEPDVKKMERVIFAYTDGIQSINCKDTPALYEFSTCKGLTLCLSGWKTKLPSNSVETIKFEDPRGFIDYLKSRTIINN